MKGITRHKKTVHFTIIGCAYSVCSVPYRLPSVLSLLFLIVGNLIPRFSHGALSGAAVDAATGGLVEALIGLSIPEYESKRYEGKIKGGSALISVHSDSSEERDQVKAIFKNAHAEDISSTGEASV